MNAPRPQNQKRSSSAGKVVLIIVLVLLLLFIIVSGTCAYCVLSNPEIRQVGSIVTESMKMGLKATNAPGTEQLRDAGCDEALVMDMRELIRKVEALDEDKAHIETPGQEWQKTFVMCQYTTGSPSLSCEEVARVYGAAVPSPPPEFGVMVRVGFPRQDVCHGVFDPHGQKLRELDHQSLGEPMAENPDVPFELPSDKPVPPPTEP